MTERKPLTLEEISAIVDRIVDEFEASDWKEMELLAKMPPEQRWLVSYRKTEAIRADLRNQLMADFPEFSLSEINMKVLRSLTPVRIGKNYTEPAYYGILC